MPSARALLFLNSIQGLGKQVKLGGSSCNKPCNDNSKIPQISKCVGKMLSRDRTPKGRTFGLVKKSVSLKRKKVKLASGSAMEKTNRKIAKRKVTTLQDDDLQLLAGPASETILQHKARHPDPNEWAHRCPRCAFIVQSEKGLNPKWVIWKPSSEGGSGGVGCCICAAARNSDLVLKRRRELSAEYKAKNISKQAASRHAAWSNYEVRRLLRSRQFSASIAMHERTDSHRLSASILKSQTYHMSLLHDNVVDRSSTSLKPLQEKSLGISVEAACGSKHAASSANAASSADAASSAFSNIYSDDVGSVLDPFRGHVPAIEDWVNCFADATERLSLRKQERLRKKKKPSCGRRKISDKVDMQRVN